MCYEHHGINRHQMGNCWRQFLTKEEKIELLEEYNTWLVKETKGVREKIGDLKKAS